MSKVDDIIRQLRPEVDASQSTDLFEEGILDSFDLVTLVSELDRAYDISIDGLDILPENFSSVARIETLLGRYGKQP